jgi:predicted DNA-binding protein
MAKMGRPIIETHKEKTLSIRVTDEEKERLKQYALRNNQTISQVVLTAVELLYIKERRNK